MPKTVEQFREYTRLYIGPKSICTCGHNGDGNDSEHGILVWQAGHGACNHVDENGIKCPCRQFTWDKFIPEFIEGCK